jgi:hypothetical protein
MIENVEIIEKFELKSNRWDFDCVSTFSDWRRDICEFKYVLLLLIFKERSRDLTISFLLREKADDFISRLSRELIMLTWSKWNENQSENKNWKDWKNEKVEEKMRRLRIYFYKNELLRRNQSLNEWLIVELSKQ